jgi:hypothetical protein
MKEDIFYLVNERKIEKEGNSKEIQVFAHY